MLVKSKRMKTDIPCKHESKENWNDYMNIKEDFRTKKMIKDKLLRDIAF